MQGVAGPGPLADMNDARTQRSTHHPSPHLVGDPAKPPLHVVRCGRGDSPSSCARSTIAWRHVQVTSADIEEDDDEPAPPPPQPLPLPAAQGPIVPAAAPAAPAIAVDAEAAAAAQALSAILSQVRYRFSEAHW